MDNKEMQGGQKEEMVAEPVFALDIGTRTIIGIVAVIENDEVKILEAESAPHQKRAVVDGQIEDIEGTAKVANLVRKSLEEKLKMPLRSVSVAAAGRLLRTVKAEAELYLGENEPVSSFTVQQLESKAIEEATEKLSCVEDNQTDLYCVGHSVIRYYLDDYPLSTIIGHKGRVAKVEIVATFLPSEVVESLYSAMQRIELSVAGITLEPIAAMNAVVPNELRMLNIVLVDIGAGTSDIAISEGGSVVDYTMATVAGDEITEAVMKRFLVDFETAENIKLKLSLKPEKISYDDILGFSHEVSPEQIIKEITPEMQILSGEICKRILERNQKPPAAVFLAGGGSQLPGLCEMVAGGLSIENNKVAVGGGNYMKKVAGGRADISGPQFATPLGIAVTALQNWERDSFSLTLNGAATTMYKSSGSVRVIDVLLRSGWRYNQIIGRSGRPLNFTVDGERSTVRGKPAKPASITVDGVPSSLSTSVLPGNELIFEPAVTGENATARVFDVIPDLGEFFITFRGVEIAAGVHAAVNGEEAISDTELHDFDEIKTQRLLTVTDLARELSVDTLSYGFRIDGEIVPLDRALTAGDAVESYELPEAERIERIEAAGAQEDKTGAAGNLEPEIEQAADRESGEVNSSALGKVGKRVEFKHENNGVHPSVDIGKPQKVETEPLKTENNVNVNFSDMSSNNEEQSKEEKLPDSQEEVGSDQTAENSTNRQTGGAEEKEIQTENVQAAAEKPEDIAPAELNSAPREKRQSFGEGSADEFDFDLSGEMFKEENVVVKRSGRVLRVTINGRITELYPKEDDSRYQFVDMLNFVDIDPQNPKGQIVLLINGQEAKYLDPVMDGDIVDIYWEDADNKAVL